MGLVGYRLVHSPTTNLNFHWHSGTASAVRASGILSEKRRHGIMRVIVVCKFEVMFSIREWQKAGIARLLRLGKDSGAGDDVDASSSWSDEWKVLLYDAATRAIISPLLSVRELRAMGVTLHLSIDAPRDPIPDVSAVYFVRPSASSLRAILDDAASARYRDATLHFASPLPRAALEALARGCVEAGAAGRIRKVTDAYLNFVALEPRLFSLSLRGSYSAFASPTVTEAGIDTAVEEVATGLFCALSACGAVPLVVAAPGGPAERVAKSLDSMLRDHLNSVGSGALGAAAAAPPLPGGRRPVPLGLGAGARPVLLLVDRGLDLAAPLVHARSYRALVDDTVGPIGLNRVTVPDESSASAHSGSAIPTAATTTSNWISDLLLTSTGARGGEKKGRMIILDPDGDAFWRAHADADFPVAIEAHEADVAAMGAREAAIRRSAGDTSGLDTVNNDSTGDAVDGDALIGAIDSLPALLRRKTVLEAHATLLSGVMARVAARSIPTFCSAESASRAPLDRAAVLSLVRDATKGTLDDRTRLAIIHLLSSSAGVIDESRGASSSVGGGGGGSAAVETEYNALVSALRESFNASQPAPKTPGGAIPAPDATAMALIDSALAALAYAYFLRSTPGAMPGARGGSAGGRGGLFSAAGALLTRGFAAASRLVAGADERAPLTRLLAAVCEGRTALAGGALANALESFIVLDARAPATSSSTRSFGSYLAATTAAANLAAGGTAPASGLLASGAHFKNAFVFVVGGGSYEEYADVQRYAGGAGGGGAVPRTIVYGATEMTSPSGFLAELAALGAAQK